MFYKKWTFSLKILVMLLAIGLIVPSAMAGEFGVSMSLYDATKDIVAGGGNEVLKETAVDIRIKFDKIVSIGMAKAFDESDIQVIAYTKDNFVVTGPTLGAPTSVTPQDGKNYRITLAAPTADVARVLLYMKKHQVEVADPRADLDDKGARKADGKSNAASIEIKYVSEDAGAPTVYSIRRPGDLLLPLTAADATVQVVVTLSEKAKEFKKDHISVTNADVDGDPVALDPVAEETTESLSRQVLATVEEAQPPTLMARGLYDTADPAAMGIHDAINKAPPAGLKTAITAYNASTRPGSWEPMCCS